MRRRADYTSKRYLRNRVRWSLADALNRVDRICWADLCRWAAFGGSARELWHLARGLEGGHEYVNGECYCRKENP